MASKNGVNLPPGEVSERNYVGDPNNGQFIDWGSQFLTKGLAPPVEANEHGTPAYWRGQPTGFGRAGQAQPGGQPQPAPQPAPQPQPQAAPQPAPQSQPADPSAGVPQPPQAAVPAPQQPSQQGEYTLARPIPFQEQLMPMLAAMHGSGPAPEGVPPAQMQEEPAPEDVPPARMEGQPAPEQVPPGRMGEGGVGPLGVGQPRTNYDYSEVVDNEDEEDEEKSLRAMSVDDMLKGLAGIAGLPPDKPRTTPAPRQSAPSSAKEVAGPGARFDATVEEGGRVVTAFGSAASARAFVYSLGRDDLKIVKATALPESERIRMGVLTADADDMYFVVEPKVASLQLAKSEDPIDTLLSGVMEIAMGKSRSPALEKAAGHKYIKRTPKPGGGYKYEYADASSESDKQARSREKQVPHKVINPSVGEPAPTKAEAHDVTSRVKSILEMVGDSDRAARRGDVQENIRGAKSGITQHVAVLKKQGDKKAAQEYAKTMSNELGPKLDAATKTRHKDAYGNVAGELKDHIMKELRGLRDHFESRKKSMDYHPTRTVDGRLAKGGIHSFRSDENTSDLPEEYLYDYLLSFYEEACEHECREYDHQDVPAGDRLKSIARGIMGELLQAMTKDKNLRRAAKKFSPNVDSVSDTIVRTGIYKPKENANAGWSNDKESHEAMGGENLALSGTGLDFDIRARGPGARIVRQPMPDASHLVKGDSVDPLQAVRLQQEAQAARLWKGSAPAPAEPTVAEDCPVHNSPDLHKAVQLNHPNQPCTCSHRQA